MRVKKSRVPGITIRSCCYAYHSHSCRKDLGWKSTEQLRLISDPWWPCSFFLFVVFHLRRNSATRTPSKSVIVPHATHLNRGLAISMQRVIGVRITIIIQKRLTKNHLLSSQLSLAHQPRLARHTQSQGKLIMRVHCFDDESNQSRNSWLSNLPFSRHALATPTQDLIFKRGRNTRRDGGCAAPGHL